MEVVPYPLSSGRGKGTRLKNTRWENRFKSNIVKQTLTISNSRIWFGFFHGLVACVAWLLARFDWFDWVVGVLG